MPQTPEIHDSFLKSLKYITHHDLVLLMKFWFCVSEELLLMCVLV